jgi:two-component system nitrogen regulation sensor histidine kinase NtrY
MAASPAALHRKQLTLADSVEREAVVASIERNRQRKALMPVMIREQRQVIVGFSIVLFAALFVFAIWTLRRLTRPLKNLAVAVDTIGQGRRAELQLVSGGALGRVERSVAALQEELGVLREKAHIQGMEAVWKDIARVMAHEIKNPLAPIRLTLDRMVEKSLAGDTIPADQLNLFLERINGQVDMLERLVNQFRSFSREPEMRPAPVQAAQTLRAVADSMGMAIATTISGDATIMADSHLLNQALLNIWKNALEAGADTIRTTVVVRGPVVDLIVGDNGCGIDAGSIERVWLPYVTSKKNGTGLGLPVVKRLVETMHGSVALAACTGDSEHGVTITLTLPAAVTGDGVVVPVTN